MEQVTAYGHPLVLVTGGEPLAQRNCTVLLQALIEAGFTTQLETAGAHDIAPLPDAVSIIMDIKTPSSGEAERNRWQNIEQLQANDEVKLVIGDEHDYTWAKRAIDEHGLTRLNIPILFSPAWQKVEPATLVSWMLRDRLPVRLQLQQHKYIWGAERTGV
jgi:7-carboxy-7-deazaguanine synthase